MNEFIYKHRVMLSLSYFGAYMLLLYFQRCTVNKLIDENAIKVLTAVGCPKWINEYK